MNNKRIYLDCAAATPLDKSVSMSMQNAEVDFANPSAQYASARNSKLALEKAHKEAAMFLQANA